MHIAKRIAASVAIVGLTGVLGFGSITALAGGDMTEALKDAEVRKEFVEKKEKEVKEWNAQLAKKVENKDSEWGATQVGGDAKAITNTELVPIDPEAYSLFDAEDSRALKEQAKGLYNLRIYLDNGEIHEVGPFKKMPKRVELVETSVFGVKGMSVIIED